MVIRSHDKRFKPIARIHPVVDGALRTLILGCRSRRFAYPLSTGINYGTGRSAICGTEFDLSRASEHGHRSGLYDIQIVTLDPELINGVRNLEGQRHFIHLHQFNRCKPPLERIGAEMQPDSARYFPPNPIVSLLHRCFYSRSSMARRNNFHPFPQAKIEGPKEEQLSSRPLTAQPTPNRSCRGTYNVQRPLNRGVP